MSPFVKRDVVLRIIVVDDDRMVRDNVVSQLRDAGHVAVGASNAMEARNLVRAERWDVLLTDLKLPGVDGIELLKSVKEEAPALEVIVFTGHASVGTAVDAMKAGAADYLVKPFRFEEVEAGLLRIGRLLSMQRELVRLRASLAGGEKPADLIARSPALRRVWDRVMLFADHDAPVLITGETGVGKEVVSRAIHERSSRRQGPFVAVASGAIPSELAESELLGHEKGSFTGATGLRRGAFERASGGSILLDDIDDLPLPVQAKILRALQERRVMRVGGSEEIPVDSRVIATTKIDLGDAVKRGIFREDLYYRLRGLEIHIPPLRSRGDEVLRLAKHFLSKHAGGAQPKVLSVDAARALLAYPWPGNVRELKRCVETAVTLTRGSVIEFSDLPDYVIEGENRDRFFTLHLDHQAHVPYQEIVRSFERGLLEWAMRRSDGRQTAAAMLLDLPRTTLQTKLSSLL